MASILQTKHYDLLAKYWRKRLATALTYEPYYADFIIEEYKAFTQFLYETQDNFRVSYFDEAAGYERTE